MKANRPLRLSPRLRALVMAIILAPTLPVTATATVFDSGLISNGDFGTGNFTGWDRSGYIDPYTEVVYDKPPHAYSAYLAADGDLGYISQNFSATAGNYLKISYDLESDGSTPNAFIVTFNGTDWYNETNLSDFLFTTYSFYVSALSSNSLRFGFQNDPGSFWLTNISVIQPEITETSPPNKASDLAAGKLNPIFAGGTLLLDTSGANYSQNFIVKRSGGTIDQNGFVSTFSGVFSDDVSGSGPFSPLTIMNTGSGGMVIFSGANTYSNTTTIDNGATVTINGSLSGPVIVNSGGTLQGSGIFNGTVIVNSGGTLKGTGTINNSVDVSGTLSPGNSPGTLNVAGTVTMLSGSTMHTEIDGLGTGNGAGNYDRLVISGSGNQFVLGPNVTLSPVLRGITAPAANTFTPSLGDTFRIVSAEGGITGKFAVVEQPLTGLPVNTRLYPFYNVFGSIDLRLIPVSWNSYLSAHGGNENAQSAGNVLDQLITSDTAAQATVRQQELLNSVADYSAAQLPEVTTALAGEVHAAMAAEIPLSALWVQGTVSDLLEQAPQNAPCKPAGNGFWIAASRNWEKWYGDSFASTFKADRNQYALGFDILAGKNVRLGAGYSYANVDLRASHEGKGSVTEQLAFLYGQYDAGTAVIEGIASVGPTIWETSRPDPIGLTTTPLTTNDTGLSSMAGVTLRIPITKKCVSIQPYASAIWVHEERSAVNEGENTPAALSLTDYQMNGSRFMAGVSIGSESRNPMIAPVTFSLSLGGGIDSQELANPYVEASLADTAFTIVTPGVSRTFFQTKAGATLRLAKAGYFYLNYAGLFRSGADSQGLEAGIKLML